MKYFSRLENDKYLASHNLDFAGSPTCREVTKGWALVLSVGGQVPHPCKERKDAAPTFTCTGRLSHLPHAALQWKSSALERYPMLPPLPA